MCIYELATTTKTTTATCMKNICWQQLFGTHANDKKFIKGTGKELFALTLASIPAAVYHLNGIKGHEEAIRMEKIRKRGGLAILRKSK